MAHERGHVRGRHLATEACVRFALAPISRLAIAKRILQLVRTQFEALADETAAASCGRAQVADELVRVAPRTANVPASPRRGVTWRLHRLSRDRYERPTALQAGSVPIVAVLALAGSLWAAAAVVGLSGGATVCPM